MRDKFRENFKIVLPAAIITLGLFYFLGNTNEYQVNGNLDYSLIKVLPYLFVLIGAVSGVNVFVILIIGTVLSMLVGLGTGMFTATKMFTHVGNGIMSMYDITVISIIVACIITLIKEYGGIDFVLNFIKSRSVEATKVLKSGQDITIDAQNGIVYDGIVADLVKKDEPQQAQGGQQTVVAEYFAPTGTGVMMNLGDPDLADKYASLPCDGIGLMREEFIWTTFIHEHPLYLIEQGKPEKVIDMLAEGISKVCRALAPRPVVLRFSDFKSGEYRNLKGGDKYEPVEPADLLGWRGASRYYDPTYTDAFRLELKAVKKVREEFGLKNLNCMIPFCRTVDEARKVTSIMKEEGLERGPDFKLFLMAEIPANIILADKFNEFVDGYSIGSNDLTMLVLGCDRNNDTVSALFDERNLAIKRAVRHLIETAHKDGKTVSICGQAPSVYPDFTEFLVKSGIDYVSVNPDMVKATKRNVARIEQRLMLDAATGRGIKDTEDYTW